MQFKVGSSQQNLHDSLQETKKENNANMNSDSDKLHYLTPNNQDSYFSLGELHQLSKSKVWL